MADPVSAATSYTDLNGNIVQVPARVIRRSTMSTSAPARSIAFEPTQHGMKDADPKASAAVLGIWLGDEVPT